MIHLPNSFTDPEETACGLIFGPVIGSSRVIREREEWWSVDCARCLNSPRGLELMRLAESVEESAELDALTSGKAGRSVTLPQFNALHLHAWGVLDHLNGIPV